MRTTVAAQVTHADRCRACRKSVTDSLDARDHCADTMSVAPTQIAFAWRAGLDWQPFGRRIVLSVADNVIKFRPSRYAAGISPMHHIMFSVGLRATSSR